MKIISFDEFSNSDQFKVSIFNEGGVRPFSTMKKGELSVSDGFFKDVCKPEDARSAMPLIVFDWADSNRTFMDEIRSTTPRVYNDPRDILIGKEAILKRMMADGCKFVPRTVFSREEAGSLRFPIIAKASNSYDSKGIERLEDRKALDSLGEGFDMYQNMVPIKKELRAVVFKGLMDTSPKLMLLFKKEPRNNKAKEIRNLTNESMDKDELNSRENTKWVWTQMDKKNSPDLVGIKEVAEYVFRLCPSMNFTGLDLAVDEAGKVWFIEHNLLPSMLSNQSLLLYKCMFEDWYRRPLKNETIMKMRKLSQAFFFAMNRKYVFEMENENALYDLDALPL